MPVSSSIAYHRPESATPKAWERGGVEPALTLFLDEVWSNRVVPWAGLGHVHERALEELWQEAVVLRNEEELSVWVGQLRQAAFGHSAPMGQRADQMSREEQRQAWKNARLILGPQLSKWFADEQWQDRLGDLRRAIRHQEQQFGRMVDVVAVAQRKDDQHRRARQADGVGVSDVLAYGARAQAASTITPAEVKAKAEGLLERFGLRHLRAAGRMQPHEVWAVLDRAEAGLAKLAEVLDWNDAEIGARQIGLSFELSIDASHDAHFEPLNATINIDGAGSFAHEWAHAFDRVLFQRMSPHLFVRHGFASVLAEDKMEWVAPEHQALRQQLAQRDQLPAGDAARLRAHVRFLDSLPKVLHTLEEDIPHQVWRERIVPRLRALEVWMNQQAKNPLADPDMVHQRWERWLMGNTIAWADPDDAPAREWRDRWNRLVHVAEDILFGGDLQVPAWRAWAQAKDRNDNTQYWDAPHERLARSFHAYVRHQLGHDDWVAGPTDRLDRFPMGEELEGQLAQWAGIIAAVRPVWTEHLPQPKAQMNNRIVA